MTPTTQTRRWDFHKHDVLEDLIRFLIEILLGDKFMFANGQYWYLKELHRPYFKNIYDFQCMCCSCCCSAHCAPQACPVWTAATTLLLSAAPAASTWFRCSRQGLKNERLHGGSAAVVMSHHEAGRLVVLYTWRVSNGAAFLQQWQQQALAAWDYRLCMDDSDDGVFTLHTRWPHERLWDEALQLRGAAGRRDGLAPLDAPCRRLVLEASPPELAQELSRPRLVDEPQGARFLRVRVLEARNLTPKNANGLSDPYVVLKMPFQRTQYSSVKVGRVFCRALHTPTPFPSQRARQSTRGGTRTLCSLWAATWIAPARWCYRCAARTSSSTRSRLDAPPSTCATTATTSSPCGCRW